MKFSTLSVLLTLLLGAMGLLSCKKEAKAQALESGCNFYYWKTTFNFDEQDRQRADSLQTRKLYLRYFDVDWSPTRKMAVPKGVVDLNNNWWGTEQYLNDLQVVPVVYITNRVFESGYDLDSLAAKIARKTEEVSANLERLVTLDYQRPEDRVELYVDNWTEKDSLQKLEATRFKERMTELQIDCDWTQGTREAYFSFLKKLQSRLADYTITCTVRLHQYRDRDAAGIPPVVRATLMCYNVDKLGDFKAQDAIYNPALVQGYLKNKAYPIPLEAALPLFSWGAMFHEDQFKGIASQVGAAQLEGNPLFAPMGNGRYRFTQDTVFAGVYMRNGDVLRADEASQKELEELATWLGQREEVYGLSFFEWSDHAKNYNIHAIYQQFLAGK